jgi:hypothetical protein
VLLSHSTVAQRVGTIISLGLVVAACSTTSTATPAPAGSGGPTSADLALGKQTFRFDTFGDEGFWKEASPIRGSA